MPPHDGEDDVYAAEAYSLDPEDSPRSVSHRNGVRHDYGKVQDDADDDYVGGEETEDSRAILLQEMNGLNRNRTTLKATEYDASDDSAAAMVHRVCGDTYSVQYQRLIRLSR